jgi:hypothetical protein
MGRFCRSSLTAFVLLYLAALGALAVGSFRLFGREGDPLDAVPLILLRLPWNRLIDLFPSASHPWLASVAPLLNIASIAAICRLRKPSSIRRGTGTPAP